ISKIINPDELSLIIKPGKITHLLDDVDKQRARKIVSELIMIDIIIESKKYITLKKSKRLTIGNDKLSSSL
uniref:hypothetical protein n=1 Tax=Xenorhabdus bovienii TaxID=40576 RepID=UPI00056E6277